MRASSVALRKTGDFYQEPLLHAEVKEALGVGFRLVVLRAEIPVVGFENAIVDAAFREHVDEHCELVPEDLPVAEDRNPHHPLQVGSEACRVVAVAEKSLRGCGPFQGHWAGRVLVLRVLLCGDQCCLLVLGVGPFIFVAFDGGLAVLEEDVVARRFQKLDKRCGSWRGRSR